MHTSKILVTLTAITGTISCFIPWANQLFFGHPGNVTGIHFSEGLFCLVYFIIVVAVCWLSDRNKPWSGSMAYATTVSALLPVILIAYKISQLQGQAAKMQQFNADINNYVVYDPTTGIYASLAAALAIVSIVFTNVLLQNKSILIPASWRAQTVLAQS